MGTAQQFSAVLHNEIRVHAAWLPITNTFRIGDYGLISDGVFVGMGNIAEYRVTPDVADGPPAAIDFKSEGTRYARLAGDAGIEVPSLPDADVAAKLVIEFQRADSFLIRARISCKLISNVAVVAEKLNATGRWQKRWAVVSGIYTGENALIVSARASGTKLEISGTAKALKQLDLGAASAGFEITSSQNVGLQVLGETGVIGLSLFKLGFFTGRPDMLERAKVDVQPLEGARLESDL
jgi:hypothetical protein